MLKINALRININTDKGLYGVSLFFEKGLNIVRGNNSSGKSTIFQSILYGLGMEEVIGGRNDKSMQSVLKNEVLNDEKLKEATVLESHILLEITNGKETITTERYVKSNNLDNRLIRIYYKPILTEKNSDVESDYMYLHDSGSATDVKFGFFAYLEKFLDFSLPEVLYGDGNVRKLYLQNIFPSFVIEQKVGWSDFLATIPYYNLKDKEKRAIEFILGLDSWSIEERKQSIKSEKQRVENLWIRKLEQIRDLADKSALELKGVGEKPVIINTLSNVFLSYASQNKVYSLNEYISKLEEQLSDLEQKEIPKINEIATAKEIELSEASERYSRFSVQYKHLLDRRSMVVTNISSIAQREKQIEEELTQNKHHKKVKAFGAEHDVKIALDICPTCTQSISDSLLPAGTVQIPMSIDENIRYLESQKAMAISYIKSHESDRGKLDREIKKIEETIADLRSKIRAIKIDLVTDDRLPSVEIIERRIKLKSRVEFYHTTRETFYMLLEQLISLSKEWEDILASEASLPQNSFSDRDRLKLNEWSKEFTALLKKFGYGSKSIGDIRISHDKLIPVAEGYYSIRFDSSASDLVRAICAYTISLSKISKVYGGNHPMFMMFDEPGNQETAVSDLRSILMELSKSSAQSIVLASFKQNDSDFEESTKGINFNLLPFTNKKFVQRLEN